VTDTTSLGVITRVTVDCGFALVAYLTDRNVRELGLSSGREVVAEIEVGSIHLLRRDAKECIALSQERQSAAAVLIPQPWRSVAKGRA
jgi:molybdopterin-binding protein